MKRFCLVGTTLVLLASSCIGAGGAQNRTVRVDFSHDQFASFFLQYFPNKITVHPGDTVEFRQTWTGEPHTVTMGKLVDAKLSKGRPMFDFFNAYDAARRAGIKLPDPNDPPAKVAPFFDAVGKQVDALFSDYGALHFATNEKGQINQNVGQPCYRDSGGPPDDNDTPCPKRVQPAFNGRQSYYSSGIIPYRGPQGNVYRVPLSKSIKPGSYNFYCAVHGFGQSGVINVVSPSAPIPSAAEADYEANQEIDVQASALLKLYRQAVKTNQIELDGKKITGPFAGLPGIAAGNDEIGVDEFVPKRLHAKVGDKVTWKLMGADHSVSFNVPTYVPIFSTRNDGKVVRNPKLDPPAGGSPPVPEQTEKHPQIVVDGGTWNGRGFFSSGLMSSNPYAQYSLRFSRPGTYRFACLVHPPMVGTIVVTR